VKMIAETVGIYLIAFAIVWYTTRGLHIHKEIHDLTHATLWLFALASVVSFAIWYFGENLLFSRLFSFFFKRTGYSELLPATAAAYFLQALNALMADVALAVFLHQRKDVPWGASGFTMAFFGFIDGLLFSWMITAAALLVPNSPVHAYLPYSALAAAALMLIAAWWLWREPRTRAERWLRKRPSLIAFRQANLRIYGELLLIRFLIMASQGLLLWATLLAFHASVPLIEVMALSPAILAAGGVPIAPAGLGPLQAVAVHTFAGFAPRPKVMAATLAFSVAHLLYRFPMGLGSAGYFVRTVLHAGGAPESSPPVGLKTEANPGLRHG
jgi:uncharacterized membrane protein YbhN (UPF0104 family)